MLILNQLVDSKTIQSARRGYVYEIFILNLALFLFVFRTAFPEMKYPFMLIYFVAVIYFCTVYRKIILGNIRYFLIDFRLILILFIYLIIAYLFSDKLYLSITKEIVNFFIILSLFFFLNLAISCKRVFDFFIRNISDQIIVFGLGISLFSLSNTLNIISTRDFSIQDYNFSLIPVFFALVSIMWKLTEKHNTKKDLLYFLIIFVINLQILISSSRRGLLLYIGFALILLFLQVLSLFTFRYNKLISLSGLAKKLLAPSLILLFQPMLLYLLLFKTSCTFKENIFDFLSVKDKEIAKYNITYNLARYLSINGNQYFYRLYDKLWFQEINSVNPASGWGTRSNTIIFPLTGKNVDIVPDNAKGYYLDNTSAVSTWGGNAYSYSKIWNKVTTKSDRINSSVYCYVSEDFNGDWVRLSVEGTVFGDIENYYDLGNKGTWQKLSLSSRSNDGLSSVYLYFCKMGSTDFNNLTGHVIFAYPQVQLSNDLLTFDPRDPDSGWGIRKHRTIFPLTGRNSEIIPPDSKGYMMDSTCNASTWNGHAFSYTIIDNFAPKSDSIEAIVYCYVSEEFNGSWVTLQSEGEVPASSFYDLSNKGSWQELRILITDKKGLTPVYLYFCKENTSSFKSLKGYVIFAYPHFRSFGGANKGFCIVRTFFPGTKTSDNTPHLHYCSFISFPDFLIGFQNDSIDNDLIRRFAFKFLSEDTTYSEYKSDLSIDTIRNNFLGPRIMRWRFGIKIFTKEYGIIKKLFGSGFNHLNWYGFYFENDKTMRDYPHNPFISILLYSGLLGVALYIHLLIRTFKYYLIYLQNHLHLFIFFLITLYFCFFSSENPFDPPMMGFFVALPFFSRHIELKILRDPL